ncbi:hypothetical protein NHG85_03310, partial [Limimaricola sp. ASW11-118]|nr:hypothetical protein [Limimaricola litoreus]
MILSHADILAPGASAALTRAALTPARPMLHGHDFYELAWVQNGRVRHHLPEGREDLVEGDVIFAGPKQFGHWECDLVMFRKEFGKANVTSLV